MPLEESRSLIIDFNDIRLFDPALASIIQDNPKEFVNAASVAVRNVMKVIDPNYYQHFDRFYARFKNVSEKIPLREVKKAKYIDRFVQVEGIVTDVSDVDFLLVEGIFICRYCGYLYAIPQNGLYTEPKRCENPTCRRKGFFKFLQEGSTFDDRQKLKIEEISEENPPDEKPRELEVSLRGEDLIDIIKPKDRVRISGVLKGEKKHKERKFKVHPFSPFLEANHVEVIEKGNT